MTGRRGLVNHYDMIAFLPVERGRWKGICVQSNLICMYVYLICWRYFDLRMIEIVGMNIAFMILQKP